MCAHPIQPLVPLPVAGVAEFEQGGKAYRYELPAVGPVDLPAGIVPVCNQFEVGAYRLRRTPGGRVLLERFDTGSERWRQRAHPVSAHIQAIVKAWRLLTLPAAENKPPEAG